MNSKQQVLDYIAERSEPDLYLVVEHIADNSTDPTTRELLAAYFAKIDEVD